MNSCGVSQLHWLTTCSWMNAIIVRPPPNVKAPTLRRNIATCARLAAGASAVDVAGSAPRGRHPPRDDVKDGQTRRKRHEDDHAELARMKEPEPHTAGQQQDRDDAQGSR